MTNQPVEANTNDLLVRAVWAALWNSSNPKYYLPNLIVNGLEENGVIIVGRLQPLTIPDTGSIPLGAYVKVDAALRLTNNVITGLDSVHNKSFTYEHQSTVFSAEITFGTLTFSGLYQVLVGGAAGCAINTAKIFSGGSVSRAAVALDAGPAAPDTDGDVSDPDLERAHQLRDALLGSASGRVMVGTYYQNNATYNELFQKSTHVQETWANYSTGGQTTRYFMDHTATALRPENMDTVAVNRTPICPPTGPSYYDQHAYFMQTYLMTACYGAADWFTRNGDPASATQYRQAGDDAKGFGNHTQGYTQPVDGATPAYTGNQVLGLVNNTPPPETLSASAARGAGSWIAAENDPHTALRALAAARANEIDFEQVFRRPVAGLLGGADEAKLRGTFHDTISNIDLTLTGTLTFGLDSTGKPHITATVTKITCTDPNLAIQLSPDPSDGALFQWVEQRIGQASSTARLLAAQIKTKLSSDEVRAFLNTWMNNALAQRFGKIG